MAKLFVFRLGVLKTRQDTSFELEQRENLRRAEGMEREKMILALIMIISGGLNLSTFDKSTIMSTAALGQKLNGSLEDARSLIAKVLMRNTYEECQREREREKGSFRSVWERHFGKMKKYLNGLTGALICKLLQFILRLTS